MQRGVTPRQTRGTRPFETFLPTMLPPWMRAMWITTEWNLSLVGFTEAGLPRIFVDRSRAIGGRRIGNVRVAVPGVSLALAIIPFTEMVCRINTLRNATWPIFCKYQRY